MKVSSLPNLNREATSFPNFFTFIQDPADHEDDDTALQIDEHSCDTETSETSPYKEILSPSVLFDETNEIGFLAGTSSVRVFRSESDHNDRTRPNSVSVGSNQFGGSEWPILPSCGGTRATSPISQETIEQPFSPLCPTKRLKRAFTQIHTFQFLEIKEATMTEAGTSKSSRSETPAPLPPFSKELPECQRADAVSSMVYEVNARLRDPVYRCAGAICPLQKQVSELQAQLAKAQAEVVNMQYQQANLVALFCMEMSPDQSPQASLQKQVSELQAQLAKAQAEVVNMQYQQANLVALFCMEMSPDQSPRASPQLQQQQKQYYFDNFITSNTQSYQSFADENCLDSMWEPLWT